MRAGRLRGWEYDGRGELIHQEDRQVSSLERTNVKNGSWCDIRIAV